jgi:hypothetical protein
VRLAAALAPWLGRRGRLAEATERLRAALTRSAPADQGWAKAQLWLGYMLSNSADRAGATGCFTAVIRAHDGAEPSHELVRAFVGRAVVRLNSGEEPATVDDARRALALARAAGDVAGELDALTGLSLTARYAGDAAGVLDWARQAQERLRPDVPARDGVLLRGGHELAVGPQDALVHLLQR